MSINAISTSMVPSFKAPIQFGAAAKPKAQEMLLDGGVSVQGNGFVEKYPDTMSVQLTFNEMGQSQKDVWDKMNAKAVSTMDALKALPFASTLKFTTNMGVQENWVWNQKTQQNEKKGYNGHYYISITDKLGKSDDANDRVFADHASAISAIAEKNKTNFGGVSFSLSNQSQAVLEALKVAAQDAVSKAQAVADAFGFKINAQRPFSVEVGDVGGMHPMPMMKASRSMAMESVADAGGGMGAEAFQYEAQQIYAPPLTVRFMKEA